MRRSASTGGGQLGRPAGSTRATTSCPLPTSSHQHRIGDIHRARPYGTVRQQLCSLGRRARRRPPPTASLTKSPAVGADRLQYLAEAHADGCRQGHRYVHQQPSFLIGTERPIEEGEADERARESGRQSRPSPLTAPSGRVIAAGGEKPSDAGPSIFDNTCGRRESPGPVDNQTFGM
jgi:hypothetical protein